MATTSEKTTNNVSVEQRELAQRDRELDLKEREITRSPWSNPLLATLAAGVIALSGNVLVSIFNGQAQRIVEQEKFRGNLLLEAIKTGDVQAATCNLDFLVESGLLPAEDYSGLKIYTDEKAVGCEGAVLPSPEGDKPLLSACSSTKPPTPELIASARAEAEKSGSLSWMSVALKEVGVGENTERGAQRIGEYIASLDLELPSNSVKLPWNAIFVNWVFKTAGMKPQNSPSGFAWQNWGEPTDAPKIGTLVVSVHRQGISAEVPGPRLAGFYLGEKEGRVMVLAGNVRDEVTTTEVLKDCIVAYRDPARAVGE